ncbi:hypothetical protein LQW54_011941 [Pestalotiopsis sp. IQ-011]
MEHLDEQWQYGPPKPLPSLRIEPKDLIISNNDMESEWSDDPSEPRWSNPRQPTDKIDDGAFYYIWFTVALRSRLYQVQDNAQMDGISEPHRRY